MKNRTNRKKNELRKGFVAAVASITAALTLGSCAALEMLDSLAAGGENNDPAINAPDSAAVTRVEEASAPTAAPESGNTSEGQPENGGSSDSNTDGENSSSENILDKIDSMINPQPAGGDSSVQPDNGAVSTSVPTAEPANGGGSAASAITADNGGVTPPTGTGDIVDQPVSRSDGQGTGRPADSSLFTDLADSGIGQDGGDIYTPGGYTSDSSMGGAESGSFSQAAGSPIFTSYSALVNKYAAFTAKDPAYKAEFCRYYITDIDDNGVPEILVETGTMETDRTIFVYAYDGAEAKLLGNFVAWHTTLGKGSGVIYTETAAMGSYIVSTIKIQDGKLFTERGEEPFMESQLKMPIIGHPLTDLSALAGL